MAVMFSSSPVSASIGGLQPDRGRGVVAEAKTSQPSGPPAKGIDRVTISLEGKLRSQGVTVETSATVGGAKEAQQARAHRPNPKGMDRVTISSQAGQMFEELRQGALQAGSGKKRVTALDSNIKSAIPGAPGSGAGLPEIKPNDPTRLGRQAMAMSHPGDSAHGGPEGGVTIQFSERTGVFFGGKG